MTATLPLGRLVARLADGGSWMSSFAKTRYVRTPAGARRYGVPIGSPIPIGRRNKRRSASSARLPLSPAEKDVADRRFGSSRDSDGRERGAVVTDDGELDVKDPAKAAASLNRVIENPETPLDRRRAAQGLRDRIAPPTPEPPPLEDPAPRTVSEKDLAADYRDRVQLSADERESLDRYTTSRFAGINRRLRGQPRNPDQDGSPEETANDIDNLNDLASRYRTPGRFTAFRGIASHPDALPEGDLTGKVITAQGFSSTSVDRPTGRFDNYGTKLEINVPEGMPGIAVNGTGSGFEDEREFILPPGTRFRVDSQEVRQREGGWGPQRYLRVTALPPEGV